MSFTLYILMLVLFSSSVDYGVTERVKMKVSVEGRRDGNLHASLFIGNTTALVMRKVSLELDVEAILDDSQNLISAQGLIRETIKRNTVKLSYFKGVAEELEKLWKFFCPEGGEELIKIVSRAEWGAGSEVIRERRTRAADIVIVDGAVYISSSSDYHKICQVVKRQMLEQYGDLWCNFWISDDGQVFEGIGFEHFNFIHNGGLGPRSLIIGFIKKKRDAAPSPAATRAFRELTKTAICKEWLALNYSLVPYYLINDFFSVSSDNFERKELRKWDRYVENLDFLLPMKSKGKLVRPIVPRNKWSGNRKKEDMITTSFPVEYVVVREYNARCFSGCMRYLKVVEKYFNEVNVSLNFNFLLAEDGRAYEIAGWRKTCSELYQKKRAILVGFMGRFSNYGPDESIFLALEGLVKDGLRSGNLSPGYKVVPITAINATGCIGTIGEFLGKEIQKLDRYTHKI